MIKTNSKPEIRNSNKAFSLIELLVVVSILGLLAALVLSNMAGARERARDARRKSDLKEIQKSLEMYKQDQSPPAYPAVSWDDLDSVLVPGYIKQLLDDPLGGETHYSYSRGADPLNYSLWACLENKSDPQGVTDNNLCKGYKKFELNAP